MYSQNFKRKTTGEVITPQSYNQLPNTLQHDYELTSEDPTHNIEGDKTAGTAHQVSIESGEKTELKPLSRKVDTQVSSDVKTAVDKVSSEKKPEEKENAEV